MQKICCYKQLVDVKSFSVQFFLVKYFFCERKKMVKKTSSVKKKKIVKKNSVFVFCFGDNNLLAKQVF